MLRLMQLLLTHILLGSRAYLNTNNYNDQISVTLTNFLLERELQVQPRDRIVESDGLTLHEVWNIIDTAWLVTSSTLYMCINFQDSAAAAAITKINTIQY